MNERNRTRRGLMAAATVAVIATGLVTAMTANAAVHPDNGTTVNPGDTFEQMVYAFADSNDHLRVRGLGDGTPVDTGHLVPAGSTSSVAVADRLDGTFNALFPDGANNNDLTFDVNNTNFSALDGVRTPAHPIDVNTTPAYSTDSSGDSSIAFVQGGSVFEETNFGPNTNVPVNFGRTLPGTSPATAVFPNEGFITTWVDEQGHLGYNLNGVGITVSNITIPSGVSPAVAVSGTH